MKTEQAIRKLGQTLWDILGREYIDKYCEDKNGNLVSVSSISVDEIAEELVNAGYGNISEYKAEIANLKADFDSLQESYEFVRDCDAEHCLEINETVKQAKIDVLNELKGRVRTSYVLDDFILGNVVFSKDIDELIKEVENSEKSSH